MDILFYNNIISYYDVMIILYRSEKLVFIIDTQQKISIILFLGLVDN